MMSAFDKARMRQARSRAEAGVTSIEFALIAPVFLILVFFGMQLSLGLHKANTVERAIEQATRQAFLTGASTTSDIQASVTTHLHQIDPSLNVSVAYSVDTTKPVHVGTVTTSYSFKVVTFFRPVFNLNRSVSVEIPLPLA